MNNQTIKDQSEALSEIATILSEIRGNGENYHKLQFLTIKQASEVLNVSPSLIRKWVFLKKIQSYRIGKCVRLKKLDLEQCIHISGN